jgi:hypothetical protein
MNFGFRYHLASLMAVFLSLFLGILIGGALFQDSALVEEQGLLIAEMETRFKEMQGNLAHFQKELDFSQEAWVALRDTFLQGQLSQKTVVLITEKDGDQVTLMQVLELAGADVKTLPLEELDQITLAADMAIIVPIANLTLDTPSKGELYRLVTDGASLVYVWGRQENPFLDGLPRGLQIDSVDTVLGEIALILGLAKGSLGHYGFQMGAEGLFP